PYQAKTRLRIDAPESSAMAPPASQRKQKAPGQEVADKLRQIEPPRISPQAGTAEAPFDVVMPQENAEIFPVRGTIGPHKPRQRQSNDERQAPPHAHLH